MGKWLLRIALGLVLAALAGALAYNFYLDQKREVSLGDLSVDFIRPEIVRKVEQSIYMVVREDGFLGTAWVADAECGTLVTNAHVAELFTAEKPNFTVRAAYTGKEYPVLGAKLHAAYKAFEQTVDTYGPINVRPDKISEGTSVPVISGYDVATLSLFADCTPEHAAEIGPALKIASEETLYSLHAGDPIALVGFQGQGTPTSWVEDATLLPRIETGIVRGLTAFIPESARSGADRRASNQVILSVLASTPGSSGSPIVDAKGEVVGMMSGFIGTLLGTGERWANRADIVSELLQGKDERRLQAYYTPLWQEQLAQYMTEQDWLKAWLPEVAEILAKKRRRAVHVTAVQGVTASFGDAVKDFAVEYDLPAASGGSHAGRQAHRKFTFNKAGRYFRTSIKLKPGEYHIIAAIDYDMAAPEFRCTVGISVRNSVDERFFDSKLSFIPQIAFLPDNRGSDTFDVVFYRQDFVAYPNRRYGCSKASTDFSFVVVSWSETDRPAASAALKSFVDTARRLFDVRRWRSYNFELENRERR